MSTNANTATSRRFFEDMLGNANWKLADEILAPDIVMHHPSSPQPVSGVKSVVGFLGAFRAGFPNMSMKVEFAFGEDEMVAVRWRMSGTHTAELFGIPPVASQLALQELASFASQMKKLLRIGFQKIRWGLCNKSVSFQPWAEI